MATPTDLEGFLRSDEDNLTLRFGSLFSSLASGGTKAAQVSVNIRWRGQNAVSWDRINPEPLPAKIDPAGVSNLVMDIERRVTDRLGPSPFGTLQVTAYPPGCSAHPPLHFERTLLPSDSGGIGEPNLALVRGILSEAQATNKALLTAIVQMSQSQMVLSGQLASSLQSAATVRTATASASDLGQFSNVIGLGLLIVFMPQIKAALGLAPDAPLRDVVSVAQRSLLGLEARDKKDREKEEEGDRPRFRVPPSALLPQDGAPVEAPQDGAAPAPVEAAPVVEAPPPSMSADPRAFLEYVKKQTEADPGAARELFNGIKSDPAMLAILMG
jgi:hypothetical protein